MKAKTDEKQISSFSHKKAQPKGITAPKQMVGQNISEIKADCYDNNMSFGIKDGKYVGLSLNSQKTNRSANVFAIGGTGIGKTLEYLKPNFVD